MDIRMKRNMVPFPALYFALFLTAFGQQRAALRTHVDFASFRYDEQKNYVELYYAFPRAALAYIKTEQGFSASVLMRAIIESEGAGNEPVSKLWRVPVTMSDTAGINDKMLIGKVYFSLAPGRYSFSLITRDENDPSRADSVVVQREIRALSKRATDFSDLEMCMSIRQTKPDSSNIFYKNTLEVIPNPMLVYGKTLPTLLYYSELYNVDLEKSVIRTDIVSSFGKTMLTHAQLKSGIVPSRVEIGSVNIGALPTGVYTLVLSYADTAGVVRTSGSKTFYVFNPDVAMDTTSAVDIASTIALEFVAMPENELDEHFAVAGYIATSEERRLWSELRGSEAKKKFLTKFWTDRDPDPNTRGNELYETYQRRMSLANRQFRTPHRPGWKTDRGRVYIIYGPPDYVERNNGQSDTKPYEKWTYDAIEGQGTAEFVFIDKGGFNDLELVHSTHRNELSNPNWEGQIKTH
jgi:GWxTD domain-containing protein